MPYKLQPTEYYIVGTSWVMWLVNTSVGEDDEWVIRATAAKGNYFYHPIKKQWILASKDELDIEKMGLTIEACQAFIKEAEECFLEFS